MPDRKNYQGKYVKLSPVIPSEDVSSLFDGSHGTDIKEQLWTYMGYGPFKNKDTMEKWLNNCVGSNDPLFFTVHHLASNQPVGMTSFLNIVTDMRRLELGHIWYTPDFQRSNVNTETIYLMLCEAFNRLKYRRVEWKCDSLNNRSRAAALRLGFKFEGIFRNHMIVKNRNRDTAWFSMLDNEWTSVKKNMETWLYENPKRKISLTTLNNN